MQSTIAERKLNAIELISKLENENILVMIEGLLSSNEEALGDWASDISAADKADIIEGLEDLENGRSIPYEDFKNSIKKRFR